MLGSLMLTCSVALVCSGAVDDTGEPRATPVRSSLASAYGKPPQLIDVYAEAEENEWEPHFGLVAGAGPVLMTSERARDFVERGVGYTARLLIEFRSRFTWELAYIGSMQGLEAAGLDDNAILVSNGIESALRLNVTSAPVRPFVFGGLVVRKYSVAYDDFNRSVLNDSDTVVELPLGVGLAALLADRAIVNLRLEYRLATADVIVPADIESYWATLEAGFDLFPSPYVRNVDVE